MRVEHDIGTLRSLLTGIERWAKRLARFDKWTSLAPPTFRKLGDGLNLLEKMYGKQAGFVIRDLPLSLSLSIAFNWKTVFLQAWLLLQAI